MSGENENEEESGIDQRTLNISRIVRTMYQSRARRNAQSREQSKPLSLLSFSLDRRGTNSEGKACPEFRNCIYLGEGEDSENAKSEDEKEENQSRASITIDLLLPKAWREIEQEDSDLGCMSLFN